jgi:spore maturation protein CgeB
MKILYTGTFRTGSLTEARRLALFDLGYEPYTLDRVSYLDRANYFYKKIQVHLHIGFGVASYNKDLLRLAEKTKPDLIYVDMGLCLKPDTVKKLKLTTPNLVHYTSEYFGYRTYAFRHLLNSVDSYDCHVITNDLVIPYLEKRGVKKIFKTEFGFDSNLHRSLSLTNDELEKYNADAVFIGHWEPETEIKIAALRKANIKTKVWGPGWHRAKSLSDHKKILPIFGDEYVKALLGAKISLGFLSKWNFNVSTSRTFEIPACGGFMLTERTEEQLLYFKENEEAVFFNTVSDLVEKAKYYLDNEEIRLKVQKAGHLRCINSKYSHKDRMEKILEAII